MAESRMSLAFADYVAKVAHYLGYGSALSALIGTTPIADQDKRKIDFCKMAIGGGERRFYSPPPVGGKSPHEWSFLRPVVKLGLKASKKDYDLPDEYASLHGRLTVLTSSNVYYPITNVGPGQIRELRSTQPAATGQPRCAGVQPKIPATGFPQRWEIMFWPTPDTTYTVEAKILANPPGMSEENPYPYGGAQHAQTILEACLAEAELQHDGIAGVHNMAFMQALESSIQIDKSQSRPDLIGMLTDPSTPESMRSGRLPWNPMDGRSTYAGNLY